MIKKITIYLLICTNTIAIDGVSCRDSLNIFKSKNRRPWQLSTRTTSLIEEINNSSDLDINKRTQKIFRAIIRDRLDELPRWRRAAAINALRSASQMSKKKEEILQQGKGLNGAYIKHLVEIYVPGSKSIHQMNVNELNTLIHEFSHAYAFAQAPSRSVISFIEQNMDKFNLKLLPNLYSPIESFLDEAVATGAQWELLSRIPQQDMQRIKEAMEVLTDYYNRDTQAQNAARKIVSSQDARKDHFTYFFYHSINYSHLPKEEFIQRMRKIQNYEFLKIAKSYNKDFAKRKVIVSSILITQLIYFAAIQGNDLSDSTYFPLDILGVLSLLDYLDQTE